MKTISRKEKLASTARKLTRLQKKLEERLVKTDLAMIRAEEIGKEIEKLKKSK